MSSHTPRQTLGLTGGKRPSGVGEQDLLLWVVQVYTGLNQTWPNHGVKKLILVTHLFYHSSPHCFIELSPGVSSRPCIWTRQGVQNSHRNSPSKFCIKGNCIQARLTRVSHHKTTFFILKCKHIDSFVQAVLNRTPLLLVLWFACAKISLHFNKRSYLTRILQLML